MQSHTPNIASNNLTVTTAQQWQAYNCAEIVEIPA